MMKVSLPFICSLLGGIGDTQGALTPEEAATPLNEWPMIISHDSATGYLTGKLNPVNSWVVTQQASKAAFTSQLDCGVRALDFRTKLDKQGRHVFHHGPITIDHTVEDGLAEIVKWVNQHPDPSDFVLIYASHCDGGQQCEDRLTAALAKAKIRSISDCDQATSLTLEQAVALGKLPGSGSVLVTRGCVDENWDPKLSCAGFDLPKTDGASELETYAKFDPLDDVCGARGLSVNGSLEELVSCGQKLRKHPSFVMQTDDLGERRLDTLIPPLRLFYHCWMKSAMRKFPVDRLFKYLKGLADTPPSAGRFRMMQGIWQETADSVVIGEGFLSSLLKDEAQSGLNSLITKAVINGTFANINLLEVNNACDGGPDLRKALLAHHQERRVVMARTTAKSVFV